MRNRHIVPGALLLMLLLPCRGLVPAEAVGPKDAPAAADSANGLQIAIEPAKPTFAPDEPCEFRVTLRNVGDRDLVLNLGVMLNNGRNQYVNAIQLLWTEDARDGGILLFMKSPAGVAGRMDDLVVPLPVGGSYCLEANFKDYWCPAPKRLKLEPRRGRYEIAALYKGSPARCLNADTQGIGLMPFWTGKVTSKPVSFEVGAMKADEPRRATP
jgi:hypothetical protein